MDKLDGIEFNPNTAPWRTSTRSQTINCLEVAPIPGVGVALRDSKNPKAGYMVFTNDEWEAFVGGAKDGEFDF